MTDHAVALLPAGETIDDFLDPLGLTFEDFREGMTGGWLFGYVEALQSAGVRPVIVCVSRSVGSPVREVHRPTGAALWRLPRPRVNAVLHDAAAAAAPEHAGQQPQLWRRVLRSPPRHLAWLLATPMRGLARVARLERLTAILCQDYEQPRFDASVVLGRLLGIPVFGSFQGADRALSPLERAVRPLTMRAAAGLIAGSQDEVTRVRARYSVAPERVARIFNPLDTAPWRVGNGEAARAELNNIDPAAWVAAWHGRVERHKKGLDVLLEAWSRVRAAPGGRDRVLLLVGTGRDAGWLRDELAGGDWACVRWLDRYVLDKRELGRLLSAADAYVFPSRLEGFPVALVEGMACGLPVVAAEAHGVTDILEGREASGGIVVPAGDSAALAEGLLRLLADPSLAATLGRRAGERAERAFSTPAVGSQLRSFLLGRG